MAAGSQTTAPWLPTPEARFRAEGQLMNGLCRTCRHVVYCTYRPDGGARWCDEYEDFGTAREHEWDLQQLLRLYPQPGAETRGQPADA